MFRNVMAALISLGTLATPALAQPGDWHRDDPYSRWERNDRPVHQARRFQQPRHRSQQWLSVATAQLDRSNRAFINLSTGPGRMDQRIGQIRIDGVAGPMFVKQVVVELEDGSTFKARTLQRLENGSIIFDLGGYRDVRRIVVYGRDRGRGSEMQISVR